MRTLMILIALLASTALIAVQMERIERAEQPPMTSDYKAQLVSAVADSIEAWYIFPDKGEQIARQLRENAQTGEYDAISEPRELSQELLDDVLSVCDDGHFGVFYRPEMVAMMRAQASSSEEEQQKAREMERQDARHKNFGFREVKLLDGNVGYLRFDGFSGLHEAFPVAASAMNFLGNSDALIIDLRYNGGGYATMIQFISSYLFDPNEESVHLNSFQSRGEELITQSWTLPYVPGPSLCNVPVYVLISDYTFSGAEEFSYNLKNLERATLVGETTGGGAHPIAYKIVDDWFAVKIPVARAINPITGTNWEGVGVQPDVQVPAEQALEEAHRLCLEALREQSDDPQQKSQLSWAIDTIQMKTNPYEVPTRKLKEYAGEYGPRAVRKEGNALMYKRTGPWSRLVPIREDLFAVEGVDYFRVRFERNEDGEVTTLVGLYDNGMEEPSLRTE